MAKAIKKKEVKKVPIQKQDAPILLGESSIPISFETEERIPKMYLSEFTSESARDMLNAFTAFNSDDSVKSILLYIDSFGGEISSLGTIAELMTSSKKPVYTACVGKAFSAGAMLFALGAKRWIAPHATLMFHKLRYFLCTEADVDDVKYMAKEIDKLNDKWFKRVVSRSKMTYKEINQKIKEGNGNNWFLTPEEAIKYGFADIIGLPIVRETRQWRID